MGGSRAARSRTSFGLVVLLAVAYVAVFLRLTRFDTFDLIGGAAVVPLLLGLWVVLVRRFVANEDDPIMVRLLWLSVPAKLAGVLARYWSELVFYGGLSDAAQYDNAGDLIAAAVWSGNAGMIPLGLGTRGMELLTGGFYAVLGPSRFTGFVVFGLLAWIGQVLFVRAFDVWLPGHNRRLYAALVLFAPTMLVWPAGVAKEAWMVLAMGMTALGTARLFRDRTGTALAFTGLVFAMLVRPHIAVMLVASAGGALVLAGRSDMRTSTRLTATAVMSTLGLLFASQMQAYFDVSLLDPGSVNTFVGRVAEGTSRGGSEFANVAVNNPLLFPLGFVSTVLRPFPWEALNRQALIVSLEGVALVVVALLRRRSIARTWAMVRANPWVAFSVVFVVAFVVGFSHFNNFGLLARERAQLYPLLLVPFALKPVTTHRGATPRTRTAQAVDS